MRIQKLLSFSKWISVGLSMAMLLAFAYSLNQIRKIGESLSIISAIKTSLFERTILRDEFYIRRELRSLIQIDSKSTDIVDLLARARAASSGAEEDAILDEIEEVNDSCIALYRKISLDASNPNSRVIGNMNIIEYEKMLFSQLIVKSYILNDDATRLEKQYADNLASVNAFSAFFLLVLLVAVVALTILNGAFISRVLSRGIRTLQEGLSKIGQGNLAFRIHVHSNDEISELASGINRMTADMQTSLTSIREFQQESAQRKSAEKELLKLNMELDERVRVRTAQLQVSNEELESFAYSVAHDLRAPLRSIDGFSRMIQEDYSRTLDAEALRMLGVIRSSTQKLDAMIIELLDITKIGKTELAMVPVDMGMLAKSTFRQCGDPGDLATFEFAVGELPDVVADRSMMERVWTNLLSNAVKYSMPCPVHKIEVEDFIDDGMIVYSVRDHGTGFDPKYSAKLFGMFQRLHRSTEFPGSGIGLAIVRRIVERHGGKTWAEGNPGEGAVFYFSIPARS